MLRYPDNRGKFAGVGQWSVAPGNPRGDNPVRTSEPVTTIASRGPAPRDAFRVSTTEDPELLRAQAEADEIKKRQQEHIARQNATSPQSSEGASSISTPSGISDTDVTLPESAPIILQNSGRSVPTNTLRTESYTREPGVAPGASSGLGAIVGSSAASILGTDDAG